MSFSIRRAAVLAIGVIVSGCGGGDEGAIKNQMSAIAQALSVPASEGELGRIARIASLRNALAENIQVSTGASVRPGAQIPPEVVGRDAVLGLAARWSPPRAGVSVEFVDVQVTVDDGGATAQVYCTAQATSGPPEQPIVDARELTVGFAKIDGEWLVSSVRPEDTLTR
jgi:ribosomal protein S9